MNIVFSLLRRRVILRGGVRMHILDNRTINSHGIKRHHPPKPAVLMWCQEEWRFLLEWHGYFSKNEIKMRLWFWQPFYYRVQLNWTERNWYKHFLPESVVRSLTYFCSTILDRGLQKFLFVKTLINDKVYYTDKLHWILRWRWKTSTSMCCIY